MIYNFKTPIDKNKTVEAFSFAKPPYIPIPEGTDFILDIPPLPIGTLTPNKSTLIFATKTSTKIFVFSDDSNPDIVSTLFSKSDINGFEDLAVIRIKWSNDDSTMRSRILSAFNDFHHGVFFEALADDLNRIAVDISTGIKIPGITESVGIAYDNINGSINQPPIPPSEEMKHFIYNLVWMNEKLYWFNFHRYYGNYWEGNSAFFSINNIDLTGKELLNFDFKLDYSNENAFDVRLLIDIKDNGNKLHDTFTYTITANTSGTINPQFILPASYGVSNLPFDTKGQITISIDDNSTENLRNVDLKFFIHNLVYEIYIDETSKLNYTRNPIQIGFITNDIIDGASIRENFTINSSLFCEKKYAVSNDLQNNNFANVLEQYVFPKVLPDGNGIGFMNIEKLLNNFMEKQYQDNLFESLPYGNNNNIAHHILKRFFYQFYEAFGSPVVNGVISNSSFYTAMLGGVGFLDFANGNKALAEPLLLTVDTRIVSQNVIKYNQYIGKKQPCFLYFIKPKNNGFDNDFTVNIKFYYTDMTSQVVDDILLFTDSNILSDFGAYFIKCGYNDIVQFSNPMKSIYRWDITIKCPKEETSFDLTKSFYLAEDSLYTLNLMYRNSLGGYDTISLDAPKEYNFTTQKTEVERFLDSDYQIHDAQFIQETANARESIKVNTGNRMLTIFQKEIKELLTSKYVFILPKNISDVFIPININAGNFKIADESDFVYDVKLELQVANNYINKDDLELWYK